MYCDSALSPGCTGVNIENQHNVEFGDGLHGILHEGGARGAVVVSHGAGRGLDTPLLEQTATRLAVAGFSVLRWNFSYLDRRGAPSAGSKREKAELEQAISFVAGMGPLILAGKSFGARVSSYVAAGRGDVRALVFYGLPLRGLGKSAKPRDWSHLGEIGAPMLFITGDRDALCPLDQLREAQRHIRGAFTSEIVPGDHSLKPHGEQRAIDIAVEWLDKTCKR